MIDSMYKLLGKMGFTDPLHPAIVHIPIGLVIGAFVFLVIALIFKRQQLALTARHASILALVFAVPSILFGVLDWIHFYHAALVPAIEIKIALAAVLLVLLTLGIVLGGRRATDPAGAATSRNAAMVAIYALSTAVVVALGWFGAGLIYARGTAASAPATALATPGASAPAPSGSQPAGFAAGRDLFDANCAACHPGGQNSVYPKLPVKGSKKLASLAAFETFLRAPTMPDGSVGGMPAFDADALSSAQAKDLFAYAGTAFK